MPPYILVNKDFHYEIVKENQEKRGEKIKI